MITRRAFLETAGAAVVASGAAASAQAPAAPPARAKGPLVWLNMDQKELDDAYDQAVWAPNQRQVQGRFASNSEIVRQRLGAPKRFAYGPTPIEGLDVYTTNRPNAPITIFIHGGAWRAGLARDYGFPAETFVRAGAHYVVLDFINVTESGGNLAPMADQVRRAVAWVYRNAAMFGGDPNRIYLTAQSSGAHLGGVVVVTDWVKEFKLPRDVVKGAVMTSGIYDLKPARLSARSSYVKFTDAIEHDLSPQRHLETLSCPLVLAHGTFESPEFQRQTRDFAAAVKAAGKPVEFLIGDGYNHFEIVETFANPNGLLGRAALQQMRLPVPA
jgi:arylformamidase